MPKLYTVIPIPVLASKWVLTFEHYRGASKYYVRQKLAIWGHLPTHVRFSKIFSENAETPTHLNSPYVILVVSLILIINIHSSYGNYSHSNYILILMISAVHFEVVIGLLLQKRKKLSSIIGLWICIKYLYIIAVHYRD